MIKELALEKKGFTLVELLVVIAIIALLAAVVLLAINPVEILRRGRDSRRLSELDALRKALDLSLADGVTLPTGDFGSNVGSRSTDGTGWLTGPNISAYLSVLPIDPQNGSVIGTGAGQVPSACNDSPFPLGAVWRIRYESDAGINAGYILMASMESSQNKPKCTGDGGAAATVGWVEVGTDPGLCTDVPAPTADASCVN